MATQDIRGDMHSEENGRYVPKTALGNEAMRLYGGLTRTREIIATIPQVAWDKFYYSQFGSKSELDELLGEEFKGVKGQDAIDKLLKERRGHVKGAFHRDDIGDIDLFWGNSKVGLQHIIERRLNDKNNVSKEEAEAHVERVLKHIEQTIRLGILRKINKRGDREYVYNGYGVSIAPAYHGNKITYLITAYSNEKST